MMSRPILTALTAVACLLAGTPALAALPSVIGDTPMPSLAPLVKQVSPAVVNIATQGTVETPTNPLMEDPFFRRFFGFPDQERRREVRSAGSGVIVDAREGYVLTNHHVVENADQIEILLNDNRSLKATVVGSDPGTDIAVLRIEDGEVPQAVVKAGRIFGATVADGGAYSLAGCTVAPGFDFDDFELLARGELLKRYPQHKNVIEQLTR